MKKLFYMLLTIAVLLGVLLLFLRKRKAVEASKTVITPSPNVPKSEEVNEIDRNKQLSRCSQGQEVQELQEWINEQIGVAHDPSEVFFFGMIFNALYGLTPIAVDGIFGEQTEQALKDITGRATISLNELQNL